MLFKKSGTVRESLPALQRRFIELKLVTWRFKDWGDVVELIRRNSLTESFADKLEPTVRDAYLQCFDQATDAEYEGPQDE